MKGSALRDSFSRKNLDFRCKIVREHQDENTILTRKLSKRKFFTAIISYVRYILHGNFLHRKYPTPEISHKEIYDKQIPYSNNDLYCNSSHQKYLHIFIAKTFHGISSKDLPHFGN